MAVAYFRHDTTEGVELTLVPGQSDAEEIGSVDVGNQSARTRDWLELAADFAAAIGRRPEHRDTIREVDTGRTFQVARINQARPWRDADTHGVVMRFHSIETTPDGQPEPESPQENSE